MREPEYSGLASYTHRARNPELDVDPENRSGVNESLQLARLGRIQG